MASADVSQLPPVDAPQLLSADAPQLPPADAPDYAARWKQIAAKALADPCLRPYREALKQQRFGRFFKRLGDLFFCLLALIPALLVGLILAIWIKLDSDGPIIYVQQRVSKNGRLFKLYKFRSMTVLKGPEASLLTTAGESRITRVGNFMRKLRLDEIPQMVNVIKGEMSLVGPRPEVPRYVIHYQPEDWATLLVPAGLTCRASIEYKDEDRLLAGLSGEAADQVYVREILPTKMGINREDLLKWRPFRDTACLFKTVLAVFKD